jgi:predicted GNAT family acetyltransferase
MSDLTLINNEFLRQFEVNVEQTLARIEYSEQERKIFLTKLSIPEEIQNKEFEEAFIVKVLEFIEDKNLRVVPTSPKIASFVRRNRRYKQLLPVGIKL